MSTIPSYSPQTSPMLAEQSGWWPSERSAKSRFKALFTRTKSGKVTRHCSAESVSHHADIQSIDPRLCASSSTANFTNRSRSTTWSNISVRPSQRDLRPHRPRNLTSWDPPPLIQAYTQAKLHDILDVPSTLTDVLFRNGQVRRNSISSESPSKSSVENQFSADVVEDGVFRHKRNWSGASTCSLSQKLFVLTGSGHVLQYSSDGLNDRLPEKILELGPESVAFASDAIPGKHWVLRISHDGSPEQISSHASKSAWSKLSFRNSETKRMIKDVLLVFDSAKLLGIWLTAIRKEIELLGGLEYRPDSSGPGEDEPEPRAHHPLRAQRSFPVFSHSSPHLSRGLPSFNNEPVSPMIPPPPSARNFTRKISRSTTDSSIHTLNDLDHIRDPSFSDDHSISTTHTSFTSTTSISHAAESSPANAERSDTTAPRDTRSRVSTPTQDDVGELSMYMATPRKNPARKPLPKRTSSIEASSDMIRHDLFVQTHDSIKPPASAYRNSRESKPRPISTVAPLPEPGHIRKISARHRYEVQALNARPHTPTSSRPSSTRSRSSSYTQDSPPDGVHRRAGSYGLFPRTPSLEQSQLPLPIGLPSPPVTTPGAAFESMCNATGPHHFSSESTEEEKGTIHRPRSSRSSQPPSRRHGKVLSVDVNRAESGGQYINQPQRSPAITDAHLETCFGVGPNAPRRKMSGKTSISAITTTTLETSVTTGASSERQAPKLANPPRKNRQAKRQKSMPSLVHGPLIPVGPPPSGPLPALPTEACLPLRTNIESQKAKLASSFSCVSRPGSKPQPKHSKAESSDTFLTSNIPIKSTTASKSTQMTTHTRNLSSVSSVGSVRHVTAWLASPRVAAFSAKYETSAPKLTTPVPDSPAFGDGFEKFVT